MTDRENVMDGLEGLSEPDWRFFHSDSEVQNIAKDALALLKQEAVVRCYECKHGVLCNEGEIDCTNDIGTFEATIHKPDWFCADGEKAVK